MAINQLTFAGAVLPCTVQRYPSINKPQRKYEAFSVPGRSGDIFIFQDAYNNILQSYEIYAGGDSANSAPTSWGALAAALYKEGYQKLSDTYDTGHFRLAVYMDSINAENSWNRHGSATIAFNCRPERFLNSGDSFVDVANGQTIVNPTTFAAKPLIWVRVEPNVTAVLTIAGRSLTIVSPFTSSAGSLYIDCETMNVYTAAGNPRNQYISGSFPILTQESLVEYGEGFEYVRIKPRWWEL